MIILFFYLWNQNLFIEKYLIKLIRGNFIYRILIINFFHLIKRRLLSDFQSIIHFSMKILILEEKII